MTQSDLQVWVLAVRVTGPVLRKTRSYQPSVVLTLIALPLVERQDDVRLCTNQPPAGLTDIKVLTSFGSVLSQEGISCGRS